MSFFFEFLEHFIDKCMEDPEERRKKLNEGLKKKLSDAERVYVRWTSVGKVERNSEDAWLVSKDLLVVRGKEEERGKVLLRRKEFDGRG